MTCECKWGFDANHGEVYQLSVNRSYDARSLGDEMTVAPQSLG